MADKNYKITFELSDGAEKSVEFTSPQGEKGKSAYEYAKEAGYTGTEVEFAQALVSVGTVEEHNTDTSAHDDIREEINQLSSDIVNEIMARENAITDLKAQGVQQTPLFANSVEDMTDTSKVYVLNDTGEIWGYVNTEILIEAENKFVPSTAGLNKRLSTAGEEKGQNGCCVSDYIAIDAIVKNPYIIRIANYVEGTNNRVHLYDKDKALLGAQYLKPSSNIGDCDENGKYYFNLYDGDTTTSDIISNVRFMRFTLTHNTTGTAISVSNIASVEITFDADAKNETGYAWKGTGRYFVPDDYEDRVIELERETGDHETRLKLLEANEDNNGIPEYWLGELDIKANTIQQAMEAAGRNKSAFLWYTDAHWTSNSKMSPVLLAYLQKHTPMNKVNFGGDIVGDPSQYSHENVKYVYEWRSMISDLRNHHSVYGNHDVNHQATDDGTLAYTLLLAPEESSDMVVGGNSYYSIDNPAEKTRYIYLNSGQGRLYTLETIFVLDALKNTPKDWHIVVISHIWFQYNSASNPSVGAMNPYMQMLLDVLDDYNARRSGSVKMASETLDYDFTSCEGKVEFCIGGHCHIDMDLSSTDGIPVIITASDANQERSGNETEDSGTIGTITESAVFGIIADYNNSKITVVGVGRGTSREIPLT